MTRPALDVDEIIAHSFKDFHTKGFDYLCLHRTPSLTAKLYFFDGDVAKLPEVVNPHDHRYAFHTSCLSGRVDNSVYRPAEPGEAAHVFQRFEYRTPLNGGDGFAWAGETQLKETARGSYGACEGYLMRHDEIHTIHIRAPETILLLAQYEDDVALDAPTLTFTRDREPPSLQGLYSRFTPDQVLARLAQLQRVTGIEVLVR